MLHAGKQSWHWTYNRKERANLHPTLCSYLHLISWSITFLTVGTLTSAGSWWHIWCQMWLHKPSLVIVVHRDGHLIIWWVDTPSLNGYAYEPWLSINGDHPYPFTNVTHTYYSTSWPLPPLMMQISWSTQFPNVVFWYHLIHFLKQTCRHSYSGKRPRSIAFCCYTMSSYEPKRICVEDSKESRIKNRAMNSLKCLYLLIIRICFSFRCRKCPLELLSQWWPIPSLKKARHPFYVLPRCL